MATYHQDERVVHFDKYSARGAYHWLECDPKSSAFNPPLVARYAVVTREVERQPRKEHVLDIGCGDAYLIAGLQSSCGRIKGVESEEVAVALATEVVRPWPHCTIAQGNCYALPFADKEFDIVLLTDVIEHLTDPAACLAEIVRVLKHDGVLILTTPKQRPDRKWDPRHEHEFTDAELRELLAGFFPQVSVSYFWPLAWCRFYSTRIGWRLCKTIGRLGWNPFLKESATAPESYGQLKAVCTLQCPPGPTPQSDIRQ